MAEWTWLGRGSQQALYPFVLDEKIYGFGGASIGPSTYFDSYLDLSALTYGKFTSGVAAQFGSRNLAASCGYKGKAYFAYSGVSSAGTSSALYEYDLASNSLTMLGTIAQGAGTALVGYGDKIYILGGRSTSSVYLNTATAYNINTRQFESLPNMLTAKGYHTCVEKGGLIYSIGGFTGSLLSDVSYFNVAENKWHDAPPLNAPRYWPVVVVADGEIYAIGAAAPYRLYSVEALDESLSAWRYVESIPDGTSEITALIGRDTSAAAYHNGKIYVWLASKRVGNSAPYQTFLDCLVYPVNVVEIANPFPAGGFVNDKVANTFSWSLSPSTAIQASATLEWREVAGATRTINLTNEQSVTLPAYTFPNGNIEWRVRATSTKGVGTEWSPWYQLTTIDQPHTKPTGLQPNGMARNGIKPIGLSWVVHSPMDSGQTAFEVETSADGIVWEPLSGVLENDVPSYLIPGGTLERGILYWRVRTYNTDSDASPWSDTASFTVRTAPSPPQWVGVTSGQSRPTASWLSEEQVGWRLQVLRGSEVIYDTGERLGNDMSHRIATYLPNGRYTFRIVVMNDLNLWSDPADFSFTVSFRALLAVQLFGEEVEFGAKLTFEPEVKSP